MRRIILAGALALLAHSAYAQPTLSQRNVDIVETLYQRNIPLAEGSDDQRRSLTKMIIEQHICEFPLDTYLWKSADPTRPPSKDAIARLFAGKLWSWDWQNGQTRKPQVKVGQTAHDISEQHPIPLSCVDHLGGQEPPGGGNPIPPDLAPVWSAITSLRADVAALQAVLNALADRVAVVESRPIPTVCRAAANLGLVRVPLSCSLGVQ